MSALRSTLKQIKPGEIKIFTAEDFLASEVEIIVLA